MAPSEQGAELRIRYQLKLILGPIDDRLAALDHPIDPPSQCLAPDRGAAGRISMGSSSHAHAHGSGGPASHAPLELILQGPEFHLGRPNRRAIL